MNNPFPHPLILGHRGSPKQAPENSLRSLALAMESGADGVELDIQRSLDGIPVVIHDDDLARTTGTAGIVSQLPWQAIERLTGAAVPSFQQVAAWAAASGAWLNVEIKATNTEQAIADELERTGIRERTVISSFDPEIVRRAGEVDAKVRRFLLTERWDARAIAALDRARAEGVCLREDAATPEAIDAIGRLGLPLVVWTVNDPPSVRRFLAAGVAAIITDHPGMAVRERNLLTGH